MEDGEDDMYDVLPAKDVVSDDTPPYLIKEGTKCRGKYSGKFYPLLVLAAGVFNDVYTILKGGICK